MAAQSNWTISTYDLLNQGRSFLSTLCDVSDVVYVQEHWLAPFDVHLMCNIGADFLLYEFRNGCHYITVMFEGASLWWCCSFCKQKVLVLSVNL